MTPGAGGVGAKAGKENVCIVDGKKKESMLLFSLGVCSISLFFCVRVSFLLRHHHTTY